MLLRSWQRLALVDVRRPRHIELDALRGLAMVLVVSTHILWVFLPNLVIGNFTAIPLLAQTPPFPMVNLLFPNVLAVAVFCAVSGYATDLVWSARLHHLRLAREVGRRYLRLVVPALAAGACAYALSRLFPGAARNASAIIYGDRGDTWLTAFWSEPAGVADLAGEFLLGRVPPESATLPVLWMIAALFSGSVAVLVILRLGVARSMSATQTMGSLIVAGVLLMFWHPLTAAVILGAAVHRLHARHTATRQLPTSIAWSVVTLAFALLVGLNPAGSGTGGLQLQEWYSTWIPPELGRVATAVAGVMIAYAAPTLLAHASRTTQALVAIGIRSYSIYLLHLTILLTASSATLVALQPALGTSGASILAAVATVPLVGLASALFYRGVEVPCVAWLHRFNGRDADIQRG